MHENLLQKKHNTYIHMTINVKASLLAIYCLDLHVNYAVSVMLLGKSAIKKRCVCHMVCSLERRRGARYTPVCSFSRIMLQFFDQ